MSMRFSVLLLMVTLLLQQCGDGSSSTPVPLTGLPRPPLVTRVPNFDHVVLILLENKGFDTVVGSDRMPFFNRLADANTLLTAYYAVTHPSLPNYLALIGGDTFGVRRTCTDCFFNALSLPDLIEESGRTWRAYQEDLPTPCALGDQGKYAQRHNPFVYFDPIRLDPERCQQHVVPLSALQADIDGDTLPNFIFITPNLCHDSHDCVLDSADQWLQGQFDRLIPALDKTGDTYVVFLLFDEGQDNASCCGLPEDAGGRIAVVIASPLAKAGFQDNTPYTHYSLLKTIAQAWGLPYLGHAGDENQVPIVAPWK